MEPTRTPRQPSRPAADEAEYDRVAAQITGQLAGRGVTVHDADSPEQRADILSAVERFERAVQMRGGDSYTNSPSAADPDHREFVIPRRPDDESAAAYVRRVRAAADRLAPRDRGGPHPGSAV
jgi:hypothetical protein